MRNSVPQGFEHKRNFDLNSQATRLYTAVPSVISCGDAYAALLVAHYLLCRADEVSPKGALINGERIPYRSKIVACAHFAPAVAAWIKKTAPRAVYLAGRLSVRSVDRSHTRSARQAYFNSAPEQLCIAIATLMRLKDRISNRHSLKKKTEF